MLRGGNTVPALWARRERERERERERPATTDIQVRCLPDAAASNWPQLPTHAHVGKLAETVSLGRRPNGFLGQSLNDGTILFLVILLDKTVSVG